MSEGLSTKCFYTFPGWKAAQKRRQAYRALELMSESSNEDASISRGKSLHFFNGYLEQQSPLQVYKSGPLQSPQNKKRRKYLNNIKGSATFAATFIITINSRRRVNGKCCPLAQFQQKSIPIPLHSGFFKVNYFP